MYRKSNRDFFGEKLRKDRGYPSSWPGKKGKDDYKSYTPLYKELTGAKVVYRGGGGEISTPDNQLNTKVSPAKKINFWNGNGRSNNKNVRKINFWIK